MAGEVTFRLKGEEASAVNAYLKLIDVQKRSRDEGRQSNKEMKEFGQGAQSAAGHLGALVGVSLSVGGAVAAIRSGIQLMNQDLADSVAKTKEFQQEFINAQFIGDRVNDPQFRQKVLGLSMMTGIAAPEVARGVYTIDSTTGKLTPAQRAEMTPAIFQLRKTVNVPLEQLVPTFAKMKEHFPALTGVEQSNISQFLLEKAAVSSPQELTGSAPMMFASGALGGLSARQTAAVAAFMTAKTGTVAQAAQGMQTIIAKLMLKDPDEAEAMTKMAFGAEDPMGGRKQLLAKAGVAEGDNAMARIRKLQAFHQREPLSVQDMKYLVGERGMRYLPGLLNDPAGMETLISQFEAETGPDKDIVGTKLKKAYETDPTLRAIEAGGRIGASTFALQNKDSSVIRQNLLDLLEQQRLAGQVTGAGAFSRRAQWTLRQFFGGVFSPAEAVEEAAVLMAEQAGDTTGSGRWGQGGRERLNVQAYRAQASERLGVTPRDFGQTVSELNAAAQNLNRATTNRDAHVEGSR